MTVLSKFGRIAAACLSFGLPSMALADTETAIFSGGCFWCVESDFQDIEGVIDAVSGFTGGTTNNPTYRSYGDHREAVQITFDNDIVSFEQLVGGFFRSIDPLDTKGQFCDRGFTYTTAVYATSEAQFETATSVKASFDESGILPRKIKTPIEMASRFYPVGAYHQDYYKSKAIVATRFGPLTKEKAYKRYRTACGRDARVIELWGDRALVKAGL